METKIAVVSVTAVLLAAVFIGASVSAHMMQIPAYYNDAQGYAYGDHYREMLEIHSQYYNNEISYEEFVDLMGNEMLEGDMPCQNGIMGSYGRLQLI